jgi:hypothetical protein
MLPVLGCKAAPQQDNSAATDFYPTFLILEVPLSDRSNDSREPAAWSPINLRTHLYSNTMDHE